MTTREAIQEMQNIRLYCPAKAVAAVDRAIQALREKLERE